EGYVESRIGLFDLILGNRSDRRQRAAQVNRMDLDGASALTPHLEDVIRATFERDDARERTAARAWILTDRNQIRDLETNERLAPVVEIGDQDLVPGLARRHRTAVLVDNLEDASVLVDVQAAVLAAVGGRDPGFRQAEAVERLAAPGLAHALGHLFGTHLARGRDDRRRDAQPSFELFGRQQIEHGRITGKGIRLLFVQFRDQLVDRLRRAETKREKKAYRHRRGAAASHVLDVGSGDLGETAAARKPRSQAHHAAPPQRTVEKAAPGTAIVHVNALAAGAAAGGHHAVFVEEELVGCTDLLQMLLESRT